MKKDDILVGDTVVCRYYNALLKRYYGDYFRAVVIDKNLPPPRTVLIERCDNGMKITLWRKEIKMLISHKDLTK